MSTTPPTDDGSDEVEISLEDGADLQLHDIEIDADGRPIEFSVEGAIQNVDSELLSKFQGKSLTPTAVRFKLDTE